MSKKDIGRLIPTKKHIVRHTQSGGMADADITYYKKPKEAAPGKERKAAEPTTIEATKKPEESVTTEKGKEKVRLTPSKTPAEKAEHAPEASNKETTTEKSKKGESSKIRLRETNQLKETRKMMDGIESFNDFKDIGIDPKAAEIFFCRI